MRMSEASRSGGSGRASESDSRLLRLTETFTGSLASVGGGELMVVVVVAGGGGGSAAGASGVPGASEAGVTAVEVSERAGVASMVGEGDG